MLQQLNVRAFLHSRDSHLGGGFLEETMTDAGAASVAIVRAATAQVMRAAASVECAAALANLSSTGVTVSLGMAFLGGTMAAAAEVRVECVAALANDLVVVGMMGI